jgi:1-acyl-sn-glycerol-3-phosphate acyltransferase
VNPLPAELDATVKPAGRPGPLLRVLLSAWLFVLLAWLGIISLAWNAIALPLRLVLGAGAGGRTGRAAICYCYRFYWACARASGLMRLEAGSLDVLAHESGGLVVAANHPSLLDALMIVARLPRSACVMKGALMHNPFLGPGAGLAGYVVNDSTRTMLRKGVERLNEGCQLVVFPEATRSPAPGQLHPFSRSIALMAQRAGVPIQTVIIETDSPYLGKGWPLWKLPPVPIVFKARLGQRFAPSKDAEDLSCRMEDYFRKELRP